MSNDNNENKNDDQREPFVIEIEEHEKFDAIGDYMFTTSSDFGKLVYELFAGAFDDFYNIKYIPAKTVTVNNRPEYYEPSFTLAFKHGEFPDDAHLGVEPSYRDGMKNSNSLLRVRDIDNRTRLAGKYQATLDLEDVVRKYLIPNYYNNGKINWGRIVTESIDRTYSVYSGFNQGVPMTEINGISLRRLCYLIYGHKIDGDKFDYTVQEYIPAAVNAQNQPTNYIIRIDKISNNNVQELCNYYGFNPVSSNGWIVNK